VATGTVKWFRSSKVRVPILPDSPSKELDIGKSRESPKATFDSGAKQETDRTPQKKVGFTIHSSKNGETNEIQQTSPTLTVAKARGLSKTGWLVHIADSAGRRYAPPKFDEILKFDRD
jgi:hypothetical protein